MGIYHGTMVLPIWRVSYIGCPPSPRLLMAIVFQFAAWIYWIVACFLCHCQIWSGSFCQPFQVLRNDRDHDILQQMSPALCVPAWKITTCVSGSTVRWGKNSMLHGRRCSAIAKLGGVLCSWSPANLNKQSFRVEQRNGPNGCKNCEKKGEVTIDVEIDTCLRYSQPGARWKHQSQGPGGSKTNHIQQVSHKSC